MAEPGMRRATRSQAARERRHQRPRRGRLHDPRPEPTGAQLSFRSDVPAAHIPSELRRGRPAVTVMWQAGVLAGVRFQTPLGHLRAEEEEAWPWARQARRSASRATACPPAPYRKSSARPPCVSFTGLLAGGRIDDRHLGDLIAPAAVDLQPCQRVRHADLLRAARARPSRTRRSRRQFRDRRRAARSSSRSPGG